ncbi:MAG: glycosyltransferase [Pseudomonadota bacterium]
MGNVTISAADGRAFPAELQFDPEWYSSFNKVPLSAKTHTFEMLHAEKRVAPNHLVSPFFQPAYVKQQLIRLGIAHSGADDLRDAYMTNCGSLDPHPLLPRRPIRVLCREPEDIVGIEEWYNQSLFILRSSDNYETRFNPLFDPSFMMDEDGKPIASPLSTYLRHHQASDMRVSSLFDPEFYRANHPGIVRAMRLGLHPARSMLQHFLMSGIHENKSPIPDFDLDYYKRTYPDLVESIEPAGGSYIEHFLHYGIQENRNPNPFFNGDYYLNENPQIVREIQSERLFGPFEHFLKFGYAQGLKANQPLHTVLIPEQSAKAIYERKCDQVTQARWRSGRKLEFPDNSGSVDISCIIPVVDQGRMTLNLLEQLADVAWRSDTPNIEVVVVDNGSTDMTMSLDQICSGIKIERRAEKLGYPAACNLGANVSEGRILLFMNNDIEVNAESFKRGFELLNSQPDTGAAGGKIILMNGLLQEAGSMLFQDGSARGVGRHEDPNKPEYNVQRVVDYCSGCFLFVRRKDFKKLEGFDEVFSPGYYEEADLCLRLKDMGLSTVYDPEIYIHHYEYASYSKGRPPSVSAALMRRNKNIFSKRHRDKLAEFALPSDLRWRSRWQEGRRGERLNIALVEDMLPDRHLGSGFVRAADIVEMLLEMQHRVTLFVGQPITSRERERLKQQGVDIVDCFKLSADQNPLAGYEWAFDALWICRTHNIEPWTNWAFDVRASNPDLKIVFDTEAIASIREVEKLNLDGYGDEVDLDEMITAELEGRLHPDLVVTVNDIDRSAVQRVSPAPVHILGHATEVRSDPPGLEGRANILFFGSFHSEDSPNYDSVAWFLENAWPLVLNEIPDARIDIAGFTLPNVPLSELVADVQGAEYIGCVDDLEHHIDKARVFIAPTRYAGGIPHKVHEAMSSGLPVVCTSLLRKQLVTPGYKSSAVPVLSSRVNYGKQFAENCITLLQDDEKWADLQARSLTYVNDTASRVSFARQLEEVMDALGS